MKNYIAILLIIMTLLSTASICSSAGAQENVSSYEDEEVKKLEEELKKGLEGQEKKQPPAAITISSFNPDISVISDFVAVKEGFFFREAEVGLQASVDPYARADLFIAFPGPNTAEEAEIEEAYITLFHLPYGLQAKVGHFRPKFGKLNLTHPPETHFADVPGVLVHYLGEEGLVETGIEINGLLPNPYDKYIEISAGIFNGDSDVSFDGKTTRKSMFLSHLKFFTDMGEAEALELGASFARGPNTASSTHSTTLLGFDLTYKWKPPRSALYKSKIFQTEAVFNSHNTLAGKIKNNGFFAFYQQQISQRWFAGLRIDKTGLATSEDKEKALSLILTHFPSEFSRFRFQYTRKKLPSGGPENELFFQATFSIGAHRPHAF